MFRHQPQAGCHLCDARHPGGRVVRLLPHHTYVCLRYGTWIGPPDVDHPAADLTRFPDIINALWFSRSRRNQGLTLLFHGHLKPVLLRDKQPQYVKWEGTLWHSRRTDEQMKEQAARTRRALEGTAPRLPHQRLESARSDDTDRSAERHRLPSPPSRTYSATAKTNGNGRDSWCP
ncbi:hypothetical protein [Streptomyces lydicus]|uniref:hypothetical protein n=1 Tax=Streptomyces lydicus TaxID=47763 RepID=UPI0036F79B42